MRLYDYAASGNCFKVRLLLGMLGVEYERVPIDIFGGDTLTCEYAMINPLRETPVLELDSGERITQSNAILWYLADGTRRFVRIQDGVFSTNDMQLTGLDNGNVFTLA